MSKIVNVTPTEENRHQLDVKLDGEIVKSVKDYFSKTLPEKAIDNIFKSAFFIVSQFPAPNINKENLQNLIVIGRIQSGKTVSFISMIATAFDSGYKMAIVFGGNTNDLAKQNKKRLEDSFGIDTVVIFDTKNDKETQINIIKDKLNDGFKIILLTMKIINKKNESHLTTIDSLLKDEYISSLPTVIIDDEGDQASLDSNKNTKKKSPTATYSAIENIKEKLSICAFISVTATPQANLLNEIVNKKYDFSLIFLLNPGDGYTGLQEFHGEDQDKYVKVISNDYKVLDDGQTNIAPESLKKAMASFLVAAAMRNLGAEKPLKCSMMVHTSRIVSKHSNIGKIVENIISDWQEIILNRQDKSYLDFRDKYLKREYNAFISEGIETVPFDELEDKIIKIIIPLGFDVLNGSTKSSIEKTEKLNYCIYIGGEVLGRGLTIEGLLTTYITRVAKNDNQIDTICQRARWLGYRKPYLKYCRVWTTEKIKRIYSDIWNHEKRLLEDLKKHTDSGQLKKLDTDFEFVTGYNLLPTKKSIAATTSSNNNGWSTQLKYVNDSKKSEENIEVLNTFLKGRTLDRKNFTETNTHHFYYDVDIEDFDNNCLKKMKFSIDENIKEILSRVFVKSLQKKQQTLDVVIMRVEAKETRKIESNGGIVNIFSGRSLEKSTENYPGDNKMNKEREDKIQIQIHMIKPSNEEIKDKFYSPFIGYYIPKDVSVRTVRGLNKNKEA